MNLKASNNNNPQQAYTSHDQVSVTQPHQGKSRKYCQPKSVKQVADGNSGRSSRTYRVDASAVTGVPIRQGVSAGPQEASFRGPQVNQKPMARQMQDVRVRVREEFIEKQQNIVDQYSFIKDPYSYLKEGRITVQALMKKQEQPPINFPLRTSEVTGKQMYLNKNMQQSSLREGSIGAQGQSIPQNKSEQQLPRKVFKKQEGALVGQSGPYRDTLTMRQAHQAKFQNKSHNRSSSQMAGSNGRNQAKSKSSMQQMVAAELLRQNSKEFKEDKIINLQIVKDRAKLNERVFNSHKKVANDEMQQSSTQVISRLSSIEQAVKTKTPQQRNTSTSHKATKNHQSQQRKFPIGQGQPFQKKKPVKLSKRSYGTPLKVQKDRSPLPNANQGDRNANTSSKNLNYLDGHIVSKQLIKESYSAESVQKSKKMHVTFGQSESVDSIEQPTKELKVILLERNPGRNGTDDSQQILNIAKYKTEASTEKKRVKVNNSYFNEQLRANEQNQSLLSNQVQNSLIMMTPDGTPGQDINRIPIKKGPVKIQKASNTNHKVTPVPQMVVPRQSPRRQTIVPKLHLDGQDPQSQKSTIQMQLDQGKLSNLQQLVDKLKQQRAQKKLKIVKKQQQQLTPADISLFTGSENIYNSYIKQKELDFSNMQIDQSEIRGSASQFNNVSMLQQYYQNQIFETPLKDSVKDTNGMAPNQMHVSTEMECKLNSLIARSSNYYVASSHRSKSLENGQHDSQLSNSIKEQLPWTKKRPKSAARKTKTAHKKEPKASSNDKKFTISNEKKVEKAEKSERNINKVVKQIIGNKSNLLLRNKQIQQNEIIKSEENDYSQSKLIESMQEVNTKMASFPVNSGVKNKLKGSKINKMVADLKKSEEQIIEKNSSVSVKQSKQLPQAVKSAKKGPVKQTNEQSVLKSSIEIIQNQEKKVETNESRIQLLYNDINSEDSKNSIQNPYLLQIESLEKASEENDVIEVGMHQKVSDPPTISQADTKNIFIMSEQRNISSNHKVIPKKSHASATNVNEFESNYALENPEIIKGLGVDDGKYLCVSQPRVPQSDTRNQQYQTDDETRGQKKGPLVVSKLKRIRTQNEKPNKNKDKSLEQKAQSFYQASNVLKTRRSRQEQDQNEYRQARDAKSQACIKNTLQLVQMNKGISRSVESFTDGEQTTQVRELGMFGAQSNMSQNNEKGDQIPRLSKDYYHKKFRVLRDNENWSEFICLVKKIQCDQEQIKIQDEGLLSAYSKCTKQIHKQTIEYSIVKKFPHQFVESEENCTMRELKQNKYLKNVINFEKKLKEAQAKLNQNGKPLTIIPKKFVEEESCTWVFQDYMNNPKSLNTDKNKAISYSVSDKLYYQNLQKSLFKIEPENHERKNIMRISHCCFYRILHLDQEFKQRKSFLKQLIREISIHLLRYTQAGLVHGHLNSLNVEYQVKHGASNRETSQLVDLVLINNEFSYDFNKMDSKAYKNYLNYDFENPECMPPEIIQDLFNYLSPGAKNKEFNICRGTMPWSHDIWSFGVMLLEIIMGFPMQCGKKCALRPNTCHEKNVVGKGIFAVASFKDFVGSDSESDGDHSSSHSGCNEKCDMRVIYQKLILIQQAFTRNPKRELIKGDIYKILKRDPDLLDLLIRMLQYDSCQRISPQEILDHPYLNN